MARTGENNLNTIAGRIRAMIPPHVWFIAKVFALQVLLFTFLRFVLLVVNLGSLSGVPTGVLWEAFLMGARFDACISGYVVALPLLLLLVEDLSPWSIPALSRLAAALLSILSAAALLIAVIGIPYYSFFHSPLTVTVLDWKETPGFVLRMVFSTPEYYAYLALFLAAAAVLVRLVLRWGRPLRSDGWGRKTGRTWRDVGRSAAVSALAILAVVLAMRGRVAAKSPIRWGTAYFSPYPFPNHLALNQVFTFMQSAFESGSAQNRDLHLMPDAEAIRIVREALNVPAEPRFDSPIARRIEPQGPLRRSNVVLVLMESMAAWKMGRYGDPEHRTPTLDSLAAHGVVFDNFYTVGTHTYNGIFSSVFGLPSRLSRHPMKQVESIQPHTGLGRVLTDAGYHTAYICTHDAEFDNMAGFLSNNGFETVVSQKDYPSGKVESVLGVPDHVMFEEAVPRLRALGADGRPFLAVLLTASDHIPIVIPEEVAPLLHEGTPEHRIVEYADWSIGRFMKLASQESWYANTIFVFVADHGAIQPSPYEISLAYHHAPLILYSTDLARQPRVMAQLGEQVDIPPTVLGLLNVPYVNNMLGVDLFRERRRLAFFNDDETIGCLDGEWFLVRQKHGGEGLYRLSERAPADHRSEQSALADSLSAYARAMYQTAQWMITNRKAGPPSPLP